MKIPQEYVLLILIGMFALAYVLDLVVEPLEVTVANPYLYFQPPILLRFPFSSFSVILKGLVIFATPLWLFSFFKSDGFGKPIILFVLGSLLQLYAVQDIVSQAYLIPLEWSLSFIVAGVGLYLSTIYFFFRAIMVSVTRSLSSASMVEAIKKAQQEAAERSQ